MDFKWSGIRDKKVPGMHFAGTLSSPAQVNFSPALLRIAGEKFTFSGDDSVPAKCIPGTYITDRNT